MEKEEEKNTPAVGANGNSPLNDNSPEIDNSPLNGNSPEIDNASTESNGTFVFRGKHYRFADDAPKMILFAGEALTHQDIISDEEVLLQLIGGDSPLIRKLAN